MDIPFSNSVERNVPFSSVIERSETHQRIHESKKFNVDIFPFFKDLIGGYVHELFRAHAFRTRYTYVYGVLVLAVGTQTFVVHRLLERGMHTHI